MDPLFVGVFPGTVPQSVVYDAKCRLFFHVMKYDVLDNTYRHFDLSSSGKNRRGRGRCVDSDYRVWTETARLRNGYVKK
jgi:hypothetical protein